MADGLVRNEIFGNDDKPTIYYLTGYGMKIRQIGLHIHIMVWQGYRVMAFEYDRAVLDGGQPKLLVDAIDHVMETIRNDVTSHKAAGVYGISLGTIFAHDVLKIEGIDKVIFSAGGSCILRAVWDVPNDGPARRHFVTNGFDRAEVEQGWKGYDLEAKPEDLTGKKALILVSKADKVIPYKYVLESLEVWKKGSGQLEVVTSSWMSHFMLIIRNLFRVRRTAKFYKQ